MPWEPVPMSAAISGTKTATDMRLRTERQETVQWTVLARGQLAGRES